MRGALRSEGEGRELMGERLTHEIVNKRLAAMGAGIRLIGPYINNRVKSVYACSYGHQWEATASNILSGRGCPVCAGQIPLTTEVINSRLAPVGITLSGNFNTVNHKAAFKCSKGHEWDALPAMVMSGNGCPYCAVRNVYGRQGVKLYVMNYPALICTKIGMSSSPETRRDYLASKSGEDVYIYDVFSFGKGVGKDIYKLESKAKVHFAAFNAGLSGFHGATELFNIAPSTASEYISSLGGVSVWLKGGNFP